VFEPPRESGVRSAREKPVDRECVREDDAVRFTLVEAERRSRVWCILALVRILDRVVVAGCENVGRSRGVDILILCDVTDGVSRDPERILD